jgi:hypothetical protein
MHRGLAVQVRDYDSDASSRPVSPDLRSITVGAHRSVSAAYDVVGCSFPERVTIKEIIRPKCHALEVAQQYLLDSYILIA